MNITPIECSSMVEHELAQARRKGRDFFISKHYIKLTVSDSTHAILKRESMRLGVPYALIVRNALRFYFKVKGLQKYESN